MHGATIKISVDCLCKKIAVSYWLVGFDGGVSDDDDWIERKDETKLVKISCDLRTLRRGLSGLSKTGRWNYSVVQYRKVKIGNERHWNFFGHLSLRKKNKCVSLCGEATKLWIMEAINVTSFQDCVTLKRSIDLLIRIKFQLRYSDTWRHICLRNLYQ